MATNDGQIRLYREVGHQYFAERVELWRDGERRPYQIDVFAFDTFDEMFNFEIWMDATIGLVTGEMPSSRKDGPRWLRRHR